MHTLYVLSAGIKLYVISVYGLFDSFPPQFLYSKMIGMMTLAVSLILFVQISQVLEYFYWILWSFLRRKSHFIKQIKLILAINQCPFPLSAHILSKCFKSHVG